MAAVVDEEEEEGPRRRQKLLNLVAQNEKNKNIIVLFDELEEGQTDIFIWSLLQKVTNPTPNKTRFCQDFSKYSIKTQESQKSQYVNKPKFR